MTTNEIISFLSNKKTTIATIISAVLVWALGRDLIAQDTANLVSVIMVACGFTANVITAKYYETKKEQDAYIEKAKLDAAVADAKIN
jgi:hypothetical protein